MNMRERKRESERKNERERKRERGCIEVKDKVGQRGSKSAMANKRRRLLKP